ncbi:MAG: DUF6515 family protein [Rikenellaceae bacterium]
MKINFLKVLVIALFGVVISVQAAAARDVMSKNEEKSSTLQSQSKNDQKYNDQKRSSYSVRDRHYSSSQTKKVVVPSSKITYSKSKTPIKTVRTLPHGASMIKSYGGNLYHHNGKYYRKDVNRYVTVHPPVGLRVNTLPIGYKVLRFFDRLYYYSEGAYYANIGNQYEVVVPPDDIIVDSLPEETEIITIEGRDYYLYNGLVYSVVVTPDGKAFKLDGELEIREY